MKLGLKFINLIFTPYASFSSVKCRWKDVFNEVFWKASFQLAKILPCVLSNGTELALMEHLFYLDYLLNELTQTISFTYYNTLCCCSVAKSCPTLYDPMDCSMPGFPVLHHPPEFAQTHTHWVGDVIQPSHPLLSPSPTALQFFTASGCFTLSWFFTSGGQRVRASASVLPMNTQGWFPLGLTGLISLLSKGLSRVFSSSMRYLLFPFCR